MSSQSLYLSLALRPKAHQHQTSYLYTRLLLRPSLTKHWSPIPQFLKVGTKPFYQTANHLDGYSYSSCCLTEMSLRSPYMAGQRIGMASDKPLPP